MDYWHAGTCILAVAIATTMPLPLMLLISAVFGTLAMCFSMYRVYVDIPPSLRNIEDRKRLVGVEYRSFQTVDCYYATRMGVSNIKVEYHNEFPPLWATHIYLDIPK